MPDDLRERLFTADTLKAEDREAITEIARQALMKIFSDEKEKTLPAEGAAGEPLFEPEEPEDLKFSQEAEKSEVSAAADQTAHETEESDEKIPPQVSPPPKPASEKAKKKNRRPGKKKS